MQGWLSILIMIALGAGFALISVLLSNVLGPKKPTPEKEAPYECGMPPVGDARERQSVKFYLVAMIFLLFDIEVAFLYPWAVAVRDLVCRLLLEKKKEEKRRVEQIAGISATDSNTEFMHHM